MFRDLAGLFSKTAMEVCEGQQYDMDFETRNDVTIEEYLTMIRYKTAVLVGAALKMGAMIGGASAEDQDRIYQFGVSLGVAFQLQDDHLDAFGNPETFVLGDVLAHFRKSGSLTPQVHFQFRGLRQHIDDSHRPKAPESSPLSTDLLPMVPITVTPKMAIQNSSEGPKRRAKSASTGVKKISTSTPRMPPTKELMKQ